ncbi:unnamed protein product [Adineta ricciae]|uniref:RING-type domain-containing protein n=1 Tax=Adineta ricciae TaxID=249248 RepID=A0A813TLP8_ADIRI|nr:unnamed protein product [Adineta ricciae]CAF0844792.1 unnamed protein product [Adineta ricciae]
MASSNQDDQVIPFSTDQQAAAAASSSSEHIEEVDEAHAGESDSWETDDEGDFYSEDAHVEQFDDDNDDDESFADIGLAKQLIDCYPTTTADKASAVGKLCDICLNEYKADDKLRTIPCLHQFHHKCIDKWLKKNSKCPMCRSDLRKSEWYSE